MKALDLTKVLKKFNNGWVAIDENNQKVVAHASDFETINQKIKNKKNVFIMPASDEYFGFIT